MQEDTLQCINLSSGLCTHKASGHRGLADDHLLTTQPPVNLGLCLLTQKERGAGTLRYAPTNVYLQCDNARTSGLCHMLGLSSGASTWHHKTHTCRRAMLEQSSSLNSLNMGRGMQQQQASKLGFRSQHKRMCTTYARTARDVSQSGPARHALTQDRFGGVATVTHTRRASFQLQKAVFRHETGWPSRCAASKTEHTHASNTRIAAPAQALLDWR